MSPDNLGCPDCGHMECKCAANTIARDEALTTLYESFIGMKNEGYKRNLNEEDATKFAIKGVVARTILDYGTGVFK